MSEHKDSEQNPITCTPQSKNEQMQLPDDCDWQTYKQFFDKFYPIQEEDEMRRQCFLQSQCRIFKQNDLYREGKSSHCSGFNHLSDLTKEEVAKRCTCPAEANDTYLNKTDEIRWWPPRSQADKDWWEKIERKKAEKKILMQPAIPNSNQFHFEWVCIQKKSITVSYQLESGMSNRVNVRMDSPTRLYDIHSIVSIRKRQ